MKRRVDHLHNALLIMHARARADFTMKGMALAKLRQSILDGSSELCDDVIVDVDQALDRINFLKVDDMPPSSELVLLMVETLSMRLGNVGVQGAWESIGIKPRTGEGYMKRGATSVSWPIWKTLRDAALDGE